jgi:hypothetical protein
MAAVQEPNLGLYYSWALGEVGWNTGMDTNLKMLGVLVRLAILSATLSAPPGSPTAGDRYIVGPAATGAWATKEKQIALWDGTAWVFYVPKKGWEVRAMDTGQLYIHNGTTWDAELKLYSVLSATIAAPPGSPANGDRYVVAATASGAWTGMEGKIAQWNAAIAAWTFTTPGNGWEVRAYDSKQRYTYVSTAWALEGMLYGRYANDAAAATGGVPVDGIYTNSTTGALTVRLV